MTPILRPVLLAAACAVAFPSMAADRCEHSRSESPTLDLDGVTRVAVDLGADQIAVTPGAASLSVKHCASSTERLASSELRLERRGDTLHIQANNASFVTYSWRGATEYVYRDIQLSLPADLAFALELGSGDAVINGLSRVSVDLGSGDVALRDVGSVNADVGSGDLIVEGATSARIEVGSGDIVLKRVQGDVQAEVGSGDIVMDDVGPISGLDIGSGDVSAKTIRGDVRDVSIGSGDVDLRGVAGSVQIRSIGSGDAVISDVDGDVMVRDKDDLDDVRTRSIRGRVIVGG